MTASTAIASKTAADTAFTLSIGTGASENFKAFGLTGHEQITVEALGFASEYGQLSGWTPEGKPISYVMNRNANSVRVSGPVDIRLNKPITAVSAYVVRYT